MKLKIKYLPFLILLFVKINFCNGQANLVQNPSFENIVQCPTTNNNITDCANWLNFGKSPDYYNACATFQGLKVPTCQFGYQFAHSGVAMPAIATWLNPSNDPQNINYREFIGTQLISTLQIGIKYFMSFFINYSAYPNNGAQKPISANKIGLRFSTVTSNTLNSSPINNFAHLFTNTIYNDTVNWLKISGSFVADSNYNFLAIGNFFDDSNTDTLSLPGGQLLGNVGAYYYVDDVCVSTDSLYNINWTTNIQQNENKEILKIFPNPTSGKLHFAPHNNYDVYQVIISNNFGEEYKIREVINNSYFDISDLPTGIYSIRIYYADKFETKRIVLSKP